ncbi:MAG: DUF2125 domain-containing protein [Roseobacter sp.]
MVSFTRCLLTSTALVCFAPGAFADVTADNVWSDWKTYISVFGYTVSGTQTRNGNALTVSGVVMQSQTDGPGQARINMDQIVLTERSDGSVEIDIPAVIPFQATSPNDQGGTTRVSMDYKNVGLSIVATGDPDAISYTYQAQEVSLETTGFEVNGKLLPPQTNVIEVTFENVSGSTDMTVDAKRNYEQSLDVGTLRYSVQMADVASGNALEFTGQTQSLALQSNSALPLRNVSATDMDAMLAAGFTSDGKISFLANASELVTQGRQAPFSGSFISGAGSIDVSMGQDGLRYELSQNDVSAQFSTRQIPLPLSFDIAQSQFKLAVPVRKTDEAEDFALGFTLDGFSMSDMLWGMFDPGSELPREPATVSLDLTGKAKLLIDFLNPDMAALQANPNTSPAELESVEINTLQIKAVGAELTGAGKFSFDTNANGLPKPEGAVDLSLQGGNGLINRLVAIGLLPEQQAMGARMMMGLLAVPGDGPDTLNSKIEINTQGHVLANGQRIQ